MNDQIVKRCESNEAQSILEQVLNQKELLQQEVELLRQELAEIKGRLKIEWNFYCDITMNAIHITFKILA